MSVYVGIDVHRKRPQVAVIDSHPAVRVVREGSRAAREAARSLPW